VLPTFSKLTSKLVCGYAINFQKYIPLPGTVKGIRSVFLPDGFAKTKHIPAKKQTWTPNTTGLFNSVALIRDSSRKVRRKLTGVPDAHTNPQGSGEIF
jgi:hypothetical protein